MDIKLIKKDFPIFNNDPDLVYLDSTATSLKPRPVIEKEREYYEKYSANVFRGIYKISEKATEEYEETRKIVQVFISAGSSNEIVFTRNTTESLNLVAYSLGRKIISQGDELVTTIMEHHSNFVPWQQLALENGAVLKVVPVDENGELDREPFKKDLTNKTKLVTFTHVSNVLGTINDVYRLSEIVHRENPKTKILVDGAQAVPHMKVDIDALGADFYVFTGHKMLGPMGIGVLWGKREILEEMPPFLFGGEMISKVTLIKTSWNELPWKFEAGTPNVGGAIGLAAACDYLDGVGMENVRKHDIELTQYLIEKLSKIDGVVIYGPNF